LQQRYRCSEQAVRLIGQRVVSALLQVALEQRSEAIRQILWQQPGTVATLADQTLALYVSACTT